LLQALLAVCAVLPACGGDDIQPQPAADKPTQEVQDPAGDEVQKPVQDVDDAVDVDEENNLVHIVLHACAQSDGATQKTYINGWDVFFREGDAVSVFDGGGNRKFTAKNEDSSSDFEGDAIADKDYYILYPYQESATFSGGTISAVWPSSQNATEGSFDPLALLSVAHYDNEDMSFSLRNLGSLLKFEIFNSYQKIVLRSIENDEAIAGNVSVGGLAEGNLNYTLSNPVSEITLKPSEGGEIEAGTYYIAFLPFAENGFYLDFYLGDVCVWSKELRPSNLTRNKIYRVKNPEPVSGIQDGNAIEKPQASDII